MFKSINGGKLPERATKYSAGFDVFSNEDVVIGAGETVLVGLGICIDEEILDELITRDKMSVNEMIHFYERHYLELHPRSSLRAKGLGGGVGIIDIDFIGHEIKMVISNNLTLHDDPSDESIFGSLIVNKSSRYEIKRGDKIGQLILKRHEGYLLPSEYTKDDERIGGFGSTDKKRGIL